MPVMLNESKDNRTKTEPESSEEAESHQNARDGPFAPDSALMGCNFQTANCSPETEQLMASTSLTGQDLPSREFHHGRDNDREAFTPSHSHSTNIKPHSPDAKKDKGKIVPELDSQSKPIVIDRVSPKLSWPFGYTTVVHRQKFRERPNIIIPNKLITSVIRADGDGASDTSSGPSITPSSGGFQTLYSAPSTPLTSAEPSPTRELDSEMAWSFGSSNHSNGAPALDLSKDSGKQVPTILTVEAASVAKVYLELYFNSILQNSNPREKRMNELEQQIDACRMASEGDGVRHRCAVQENGYLRQCRAFKTRIRSSSYKQKNPVDFYDITKTLGKGSFGEVHLVREKDVQPREDDLKALRNTGPFARLRRTELNSSAVDVASKNRRRCLNEEKKECYAMKVIKKSDMVRNCQEGHVRAERDFLVVAARSRWVVPLIASFQDDNFLYLVMDFMIGGDFLGLLIRKNILSEDWTRFYIAEMVLCIEEAHRLCWIHRDIKPDNFLISASGHLKISDFGLAFDGHWSHDQAYYNNQRYTLLERLGIDVKGDQEDQVAAADTNEPVNVESYQRQGSHCPKYEVPATDILEWRNQRERRRFAKSVVGTSSYMAPEVIRGEMYDGRCDWWSLGIILYEVSDIIP